MKPVNTAPKHAIIWAFVKDDITDNHFWTLAVFDGGDWVGVTEWDESPNENTFEYYDWIVLGWETLEEPRF